MGYQFKGKIILAGDLNVGRADTGLIFQEPGKRNREQFRDFIFIKIPCFIHCITG